MDSLDPALFFSPALFPPRTERLIELVDAFRWLGYALVIIDWGNLFPWSEERFRGPLAYPEHAVVEVHKRAAESGLTLLPRLPAGGGMSTFLSLPRFKNLRLDGCYPDLLDPVVPGAAKFVSDLLEDMRALLPDLPGIYIDPELNGSNDEHYIKEFLGNLLPRLLEDTGDLPVVAHPCIAGSSGVCDRCASLVKEPDRFCELNYRGLPPTIEIYLDLMPRPSRGGASEIDHDLSRARKLRDTFERFLKDVDACWDLIRYNKETCLIPPSMGNTPEKTRADLRMTVDELQLKSAQMSESLDDALPLLEPLVAPGTLRQWGRSKIGPVRDQITQLQMQAYQVETWIETE